jgi:hypothetical protein
MRGAVDRADCLCYSVAALLLFSRYDDRGIVSAIDNWNKKEEV